MQDVSDCRSGVIPRSPLIYIVGYGVKVADLLPFKEGGMPASPSQQKGCLRLNEYTVSISVIAHVKAAGLLQE